MNIAILGNGQLAQMLSDNAEKLNVSTTSFPLPKTDRQGNIEQAEIDFWLNKLKDYDAITYEIENIPVELLEKLNQFVPVNPSIKALETAQDRLKEKKLCNTLNVPTNRFMAIKSLEDLESATELLGLPLVLKTCRFGYDGKGQFVLKEIADIQKAWALLGEAGPLIAEAFVDFEFEVSQVSTRNKNGEIIYYPLVRNEHRDGILRESYVLPNQDELSMQAKSIARVFLEYFDYVGTFAIELFARNGVLLVNEMAPRVHNSGHWSINGSTVSQFENHLRAVSDQNLVQPELVSPYAMMINLIGEDVPENWRNQDGIYARSYGKSLRENRKMGHINITADSKEELNQRLNAAYDQLAAQPCLFP
ncbi:5-(carboxyamino)imidazole ribonucleotide synthase [Thiotrichales bacterium 19S9-12]|nr:5-(carboxyamino)imidazole ribonucleotide synthase [Thiotrichales bacterium 19S9-11]MCF6812124.1 5-(carboxyamino)imidazole ribonucleotide synthase [Thiotrichales bacterium 19S9-12]